MLCYVDLVTFGHIFSHNTKSAYRRRQQTAEFDKREKEEERRKEGEREGGREREREGERERE